MADGESRPPCGGKREVPNIRKKYIIAGFLLAVLLLCMCPQATAAPAADLSMQITDFEQVGGAFEFNVEISIAKPSEPYASMDFSIVSSNEESLHIVDLSAAGDKSKLAVEFTPDYGGAYHKGRINEADGSVSYLVGIFSRESGNKIAEETGVCTVRFSYTGDAEAELSLDGLKLIYKNPEGEITGVPMDNSVSQTISQENLEYLSDAAVPLGVAEQAELAESAETPPAVTAEKPAPVVYILGAVALVLVISAIVVPSVKAKQSKAAARRNRKM